MDKFAQLQENQQHAINWLVDMKLQEALKMGSKLAVTNPTLFLENARQSEADLILRGKSDVHNVYGNPQTRERLERMYGITKQALMDKFAEESKPVAEASLPPAEKPKRSWFFK